MYVILLSMNIGDKLSAIRKSKGMTQEEVADRAGMRQGMYSQIENNKVNQSRMETLERIFHALKLTDEEVSEFLVETKLQELDMYDPEFVLMLKDVRNMTSEEKQSILDAYQHVKLSLDKRSHD